MFEEFKNAVVNLYTELKEKNQLSENLCKPTRASLKRECLDILKNRYHKKDDETLKAFFDPKNKFASHEESIEKFDPDGFKALLIFFSKKVNIRKEKNIKILAWLINFEPRPYVFGEDYKSENVIVQEVTKEDLPKDVLTKPKQDDKETSTTISTIEAKNARRRWELVALIILFLTLITSVLYNFEFTDKTNKQEIANEASYEAERKKIPIKFVSNANQSPSQKRVPSTIAVKNCMVWQDDHYEAVNCDEETNGSVKFVLNSQQVAHFKKINQPDTLTRNALGKTWYVKINGLPEYYTADGFHPIYTEKKLKKLTDYMLKKYILNKR